MNNPPNTSGGLSLSPREILHMLFRNKWKIMLCTVLGFGVAVYFYTTLPAPFQSTAKLMVRFVIETAPMLPGVQDDGVNITSTSSRGGEAVMINEIEILTSWDLAREVAQKVGPAVVLNDESSSNVLSAAAQIRGNLIPAAPKRGSVLNVTYRNPSPDAAVNVLAEIINRYLERHLQAHRSRGSFDILQRETESMRSRLRDTRSELAQVRNSLGITTFADAQRDLNAEIRRLESAITEERAGFAERQARLESLRGNQPGTQTETNSAPAALPLAPVDVATLDRHRQLGQRLADFRRSEHQLLQLFTPENVSVRRVQEDIAAIETEIRDLETANPGLVQVPVQSVASPGGGVAAPRFDYSLELAEMVGSKARLHSYTNELANLRVRMSEVLAAEIRIVELERRVVQEETTFLASEANLQRAKFDEALDPTKVPNINVLQTPSLPSRDNSQRMKFAGAAAGIGLALGLGLAFLREFLLDQSVRTPLEIETRFQLPMFMSIPLLSDRQPVRLLTNGSGKSSGETAARPERAPWEVSHFIRPYCDALRDRLIMYFQLKNIHHKPKLVAVTSCSDGAGTTTLAAGLAASLSETGDGKVLLVDMNVARPEMHPFFRGNLASSLTDLFQPGAKPAHGQYDNLYLATGTERNGEVSPLLPAKFYEMLPRMRSSDFDYIIFDMPAVKQTSATVALSGFMDKVLLLVEPGKTNRDAVKRATELMRQQHADVAGVVNRLPASAMKWLQPELA